MNSRKFFLGLASVCMAASMAACSSSPAEGDKPKDEGTASTGSSTPLIAGTTQELNGIFNPIYYVTAYDGWVINMVYQSMTAYTAEGELVPQLAEAMPEISEDQKTITFKIKEGQQFSDGTVLDANDVKYTFMLMADPDYVGERLDGSFNFIEGWNEYQNGDAEDVSGIVVEDDHTISFTLGTPDMDAAAGIGTMYIMSDEQYTGDQAHAKGNLEVYKTESSKPLGSGPYVLSSYDKSTGAALTKNENFVGEGDYKIQQVMIKTIATGTELSSLQSGDINYLPEMIEPSIIGPASMDENIAVDYYFRPAEGYVGFNCAEGSGPTSSVEVRQALAYAFPRQEFCDTYYKFPEKDGVAQVSDELKDVEVGYVPTAFWSPVATTMGDYTTGKEDLEGLVVYDYDLDKAKQILDDAGWVAGSDGIREKDGQKLTVKFILSEGNSVLETLVPMLLKSWGDLGVEVQQTTVDFNTLISMVTVESEEPIDSWNCFFMATSFTGLGNTTMNDLLGYMKGTDDDPQLLGSNYVRIVDKELNDYLYAGKETSDEAVSIENYKKAMVRESQLSPYVALYGNQLFNIYNNKVKGIDAGSVCSWSSSLANASIEE